MFSDSALERSPQWGVYVGPDIGGPEPYVPPTSFTIVPPSNLSDWMQVATVGPSYTDGMAALHRPFQPFFDPSAVYVTFEFDMMTDGDAPVSAQAIEFENCFCDTNSYYYNGSLQINYQAGGELQAWAGPANPWVNTGINLGILVPLTPYHFKVRYLMNTVKRTLSTLAVALDGVVHTMGAQFQNVAAALKNPPWTSGVYVQYQLDLAHAGGQFSIFVRNVAVEWE